MDRLTNDDDWACFIDGDAMFTTPFFGTQIRRTIEANPKCKLFTAITNRVATPYQCVKGMWGENDMRVHFKAGKLIAEKYDTTCVDITNNAPFSGVLMLIQKKEWKRVGGFAETGEALGIDNSIHYAVRDNKGLVYMMQGVYMLHYYRNGDILDKKHLIPKK